MSCENKQENDIVQEILEIETKLCKNLQNLKFGPPVDYVYNPLEYAFNLHKSFLRRYCSSKKDILLLGMNPGPWGMAQTGIPFGEVKIVKDWFQIIGNVSKPLRENISRPILGLECHRSEVSGKQFWNFFKDLCVCPDVFFKHSFIYNVCPLLLMRTTGKNITPTELKDKHLKQQLLSLCQETLAEIIITLGSKIVVAIGKFAETTAKVVNKQKNWTSIKIVTIPHPSPRNLSCKDWPSTTYNILKDSGLLVYYGR